MDRIARIVLVAMTMVIAASPGLIGAGAGVASAAPGAATGPTPMVFTEALRRCDFSKFQYVGGSYVGRVSALLRTEGGDVVADVQIATGEPDTRYDLRLIQLPRSSASTCNGGEPGVSATALFTNGAGAGAATVRGPIMSAATGAWLYLTRPSPYSQQPEEFYSTDSVAAI